MRAWRPDQFPTPGSWARVVQRRYHLHFPGIAYAATLVVIVLGAINGQNNLLFWIFGLGVAGLALSGVISGAALMGIEIRRELPRVGAVGEPMPVRYDVRSRNWLFPSFAVTIEEIPGLRKGRFASNWSGHTGPVVAYAAHIPTRGETVAACEAIPTRRGVATFAAIRVWTTFPFGLTRKSVTFVQPAEVLIRPHAGDVASESLLARVNAGEEGLAPQRARVGDEFFSLREYVPGDATRRIAWRPSARLGRVVVRELSARAGRRVWLAGASDEATAEAVVSAMAGVARELLDAGLEVGVISDRGVAVQTRRGSGHLGRCLDALAVLDPTAQAQFLSVPERDSVVVVASVHGRSVTPGAIVVGLDELGAGDAGGPPAPAPIRKSLLERIW